MLRKIAFGGAVTGVGVAGSLYYISQQQQKLKTNMQISTPAIELPAHVKYLLVGGDASTFGAYRAIRSSDPASQVFVVGEETHLPYMRPPLSKELWQGNALNESLTFKQWNGRERSIMFEHPDFFLKLEDFKTPNKAGVAYVGGIKATKVDPQKQIVYFANGSQVEYDKCLISTGLVHQIPPQLSKLKGIERFIVHLQTIEDFKTLQQSAIKGGCIAVLGGGITASELTANLVEFGQRVHDSGVSNENVKHNQKLKVVQIFPEAGNMCDILPEYLGKWLSRQMSAAGAHIFAESDLSNAEITSNGKQLRIILTSGESVVVDRIVIAPSHSPDVRIANESDLEVDKSNGGIVVNAEFEARRNLFVAGDGCSFFDPRLGRRRFEGHDHAIVTGRIAGRNMAGQRSVFSKQSMMWSDVGDLVSFEGVGLIDPSLNTYSVFFSDESEKTDLSEKLKKGIVFYKNEDDVVVGVLLCNIFGQISNARRLISEQKQLDLKCVAKAFYEKPMLEETYSEEQ